MKCYVCGEVAVPRHGRKNMCVKHHRFNQMQRTAKTDKKYVPSIYELEKLVPEKMICQDCGVIMNWIDGDRSEGAVLQHYRNGTLAIVCMGCNTKHGLMPGDMYRYIPIGQKLCTSCKTVKHLNEFGKRSPKENDYPKSKCKTCELAAQKKWKEKNPEKYKALNKKHNDKKKLNPEKYQALDRKYYAQRKEKDGKNTPKL